MASQAPNMLPLLYNGLEPLNRNLHANYKVRRLSGLDRVATAHAIPVTVDEFAMIQRHCPIVFSSGDAPVPIALMGLHEGTNTFFDEKGVARDDNVYLPAYLRRFPFVLARLREDSDELSLCFDPTSGAVGEFDEGEPLFDGEESVGSDQGHSPVLRAVRAGWPAHSGLHGRAQGSGPSHGRRSGDPA